MATIKIPIKEEIDFVRDMIEYSKKKSPLIKEHPELAKLLKDIVGGDYKLENEQIYFRFTKAKDKNQEIPLYMGDLKISHFHKRYILFDILYL